MLIPLINCTFCFEEIKDNKGGHKMKINDIIKRLEQIKRDEGNIDVIMGDDQKSINEVVVYEFSMRGYTIKDVLFLEKIPRDWKHKKSRRYLNVG